MYSVLKINNARRNIQKLQHCLSHFHNNQILHFYVKYMLTVIKENVFPDKYLLESYYSFKYGI